MTITFVLGDVVGSTRQWIDSPSSMADALARLDNVVNAAAREHDGERPIEQGEGDSFVVTFARATDALAFAIEVQRADMALSVRMSIHTGEAERREDGRWLGPTLNRGARIRALAAGGQVLVSGATSELAIDSLPDGASLRDLGRHRLRDLATPEHVRQLCHPDLAADFPSLSSLGAVPNNLPLEITTFVGRERELAEVAALLAEGRLVTLAGAGGSGKTRLALHVSADRLDEAPDGVWLADLSGIVEADLVPSVLAQAMGVVEQPLQTISDAVRLRLAPARALVIIDNCEHVLDASAALVDLLVRSCPDVRIIATSREPLGVNGELVYRVPSLDGDAAAQLFADRARAVRPSFALDDRTAPAVTSICERVDGLPLAIELTAARVRALSPVEINTQLGEQFRLLSAGRRGALPRQRTLEASVQWSHDLLTENERVALRRLSVFASGFTLDAAQRVATDDSIDEWGVVDLLTSLVDRSLVQAEQLGDHMRYRLLETVRVFAAQQLAAAGEVEATRDRHLEFFADTRAGDLGVELDNIRAALDWATETAKVALGIRLVAVSAIFLALRLASEGYRRVLALLALPDLDAPARALLSTQAGWLAWWRGDVAAVELHAHQATEASDASGDVRSRAHAKMLRGQMLFYARDAACEPLMAEAIADLHTVDVDIHTIIEHFVYSDVLACLGRLDEAKVIAGRQLERARSLGDPLGVALAHLPIGNAAISSGDVEATRLHATAALNALDACPGTFLEDLAQIQLAVVTSASGAHPRAIADVEAFLVRARANEAALAFTTCAWFRFPLFWRAGLHWEAELAAEAVAMADILGYGGGTPFFGSFEAEHLLVAGDVADARRVAERALAACGESVFATCMLPFALRAVARAELAAGDASRAEDLAHEAIATLLTQGSVWGLCEAIDLLSEVAVATGAYQEAARLLGASDAIRADTGWVRGVHEQAAADRVAAALTDALGADAYQAARTEGRAMSRDEAIAFVQRGRGKRGRPNFGWSSLTPTETEVARLVAEGLANKAIAEKLFMSPATVKTHLTHIYAKLGLSSRTELAAQTAQRA